MALSTAPTDKSPTDLTQDESAIDIQQDAEILELEVKTGIKPGPDPTPTPASTQLTVKAVTGSAADGTNVATNAIDNDATTRFSSLGIGAFLKLDLDSVQTVGRIDFEWYDKPPRDYNVDITFDANPKTYNHLSTGATSSLVISPAVNAQTITITLVTTSNPTKWLSIVSAKVFSSGSVPIPIDHTCPAGQHWDDTLGQCVNDVPPPPPPPGSKVDAFGVTKIYDDAAPPVNNWSFTSIDDPRFYEEKPKATSDPNWFTYQSLKEGRIEVRSKEGLEDTDIETFWYQDVIKKGYLNLPRNDPSGRGDWGDIEMTQAIRNCVPGSGSYEAHTEMVRGGFRQSTNSGKAGKDGRVVISCEAMSMHNNVYPPPGSNRCKFEKDTKHTDGYTAHDPEFAKTMTNIDQVKGYIHKAVWYRVPDSTLLGGYAMKMETYVSTDGLVGKTFKMIAEYLDNGKWGPTKGGVAASCGCPNEYPIHSMDVCAPGWRIDFMKSFEFGKLSIRSIDPKKKLV